MSEANLSVLLGFFFFPDNRAREAKITSTKVVIDDSYAHTDFLIELVAGKYVYFIMACSFISNNAIFYQILKKNSKFIFNIAHQYNTKKKKITYNFSG